MKTTSPAPPQLKPHKQPHPDPDRPAPVVRSVADVEPTVSGSEKSSIPAKAVTEESALMTLVKSWQRCGPTDRRLFLEDVRAGSLNLWRTIERDTGGRRR
jgi:hypothetical protein